MALHDLNRSNDTPIATLKVADIAAEAKTYPPPVDDMTVANEHAAKPRHDSMDDWHGGTVGNDIDVADATQAIAGQNGGINPDYEPRHQEEKAEDMVPPLEMLSDLGIDYGAFTGLTGRTGTIEPGQPYPEAEPEGP